MNIELFEDVIRRLKLVEPHKFYMGDFVSTESEEFSVSDTVAQLNDNQCSTRGCIVGWCCAWYPDRWTFSSKNCSPELNLPDGQQVSGVDAICAFLDIPGRFWNLFSCEHGDASPKDMVNVLQTFLDEHRNDPKCVWKGIK